MIDNICIGATADGQLFYKENLDAFQKAIFENSSLWDKPKNRRKDDPVYKTIRIRDITFKDDEYFPLALEEFLKCKPTEEIELIECIFEINEIYDLNKKITFNNCTFNNQLNPITKKNNSDSIKTDMTYVECTFNDNVESINSTYGEKIEILNLHFYKGKFKKIKIHNFSIPCELLSNEESTFKGKITTINEIELKNCTFKDRFHLNGDIVSSKINIDNCLFEKKVEIKKSKSKKIAIKNSNFIEIADFHGTQSDLIEIEQCVFEDFFGFENCTIGAKGARSPSAFKYTTFKNLASFRDSTFNDGLDLSKTNALGRINFLDIDVSLNDTKRETFRLIKHTLDSEGNFLEANKFFALELDKYREDIKGKEGKCIEKIVYFFNKYISNFGRNYFLALFWIVILMLLMAVTNFLYEENYLYEKFPSLKALLPYIDKLNGFASGNTVLKSVLPKDREFIALIITFFTSVCTWQFVVALKRYTRR